MLRLVFRWWMRIVSIAHFNSHFCCSRDVRSFMHIVSMAHFFQKKNPSLLFRSFASAHCFNRTFISIINLVCLSRFELFGDVVSRLCCLCCHCWWVLGALFCYYFGGRLPCEMFCGLDSWGKSPLTSIHLSFVPFIPHLLVPLGTISLCRVDDKLPLFFVCFLPAPFFSFLFDFGFVALSI
jgi:hypothetical protein